MSADQAFQEILTDTLLTEIVERILATGSPQRIILFGSRARGEARRDSDYDLLLVEPSTLPRHKRAARYRRALIGISPAKDILVWTPEEIAEWRDVPNAFVTTAVREGILLYEKLTALVAQQDQMLADTRRTLTGAAHDEPPVH